MKLEQRSLVGDSDLPRMLALARTWFGDHLHVTDLPYRLSSWALDDPDNGALWTTGTGELVAWAVLQAPFWTLDLVCAPDAVVDIFPVMLAWADQRARVCAGTRYERPAWFVNVFAGQSDRIHALEDVGFVCQSDAGEDSWSKVWLWRAAGDPLADVVTPTGVVLRPLAGEGEVEAYVALHQAVFESKNMTVPWRARTLRHPDYCPGVDLIAVSPEGQPVAFCIGWLGQDAEGRTVGQIEPLGVDARHRGQGLGRAILLETLRRLYQGGAEQVYVETDNYRDAALGVYESVGFRVIRDVLVFRRDAENSKDDPNGY